MSEAPEQQQQTVENSVIQDLGIQLANLIIQKGYAEGQAKAVQMEAERLRSENMHLREQLQKRDEDAKQPEAVKSPAKK